MDNLNNNFKSNKQVTPTHIGPFHQIDHQVPIVHHLKITPNQIKSTISNNNSLSHSNRPFSAKTDDLKSKSRNKLFESKSISNNNNLISNNICSNVSNNKTVKNSSNSTTSFKTNLFKDLSNYNKTFNMVSTSDRKGKRYVKTK